MPPSPASGREKELRVADDGKGARVKTEEVTPPASEEDGGSDDSEGEGWTPEQEAALSVAQLQVDPTCRNFWHEVAKAVPGNKTADECFQKHFQRHPTPVNRKTRSLTGEAATRGNSDGDRMVANAPSAQVKREMKKLKGGKWKRLKRSAPGQGREEAEEEERDPMGMTQALLGGAAGGKPKTLAAAIVSALAEVQPQEDENDEEDEDFYFDEDL